MIKTLAHACIAAADLPATERFYCKGLGLRKAFDFLRNHRVVGFYLAVSEGTFIEVFEQQQVDTTAKSPIGHLCFEVADLDGFLAHLTSLGYEATAKTLGADHSWQAWTTDPAGVRIEFHQYTDQSAQRTGRPCVLDV